MVVGLMADGSSWAKVISLLLSRGMSVNAAQIPLTSIEEDAAATKRIIADAEGAAILVGHSWGGMAINQAGGDPKMSALVYVSTFATRSAAVTMNHEGLVDRPSLTWPRARRPSPRRDQLRAPRALARHVLGSRLRPADTANQ